MTQATTVFLCTSNPAHRSLRTCICSFLPSILVERRKDTRGAKGTQVSYACSSLATWQQSALLDAPGSALDTDSEYQKISTSPRSFRLEYTSSLFSPSSTRRSGSGAIFILFPD